MTPQEKAEQMMDKFTVYDWEEVEGYYPSEKETKKMVKLIIEEILELDDFSQEGRKYWNDVLALL